MQSFAIGKVIEPVVRTTENGKQVASFGLLVGQSSERHDVWKNAEGKGSNAVYDFCTGLKDGETVIVVIGAGVGKRGDVRYYINNIRRCSPDLQKTLKGVFADA